MALRDALESARRWNAEATILKGDREAGAAKEELKWLTRSPQSTPPASTARRGIGILKETAEPSDVWASWEI